MEFRIPALAALLIAPSSLPLEAAVINADSALAPKVYSPNGLYGFWPAANDSEEPPCYWGECFSIVMSGPEGLKVRGLWPRFSYGGYSALITDSGNAIMSFSLEYEEPHSLLHLWNYTTGSYRYLNSRYYFYPGYRDYMTDPVNPSEPLPIDPVVITPLFLTDTRLIGQVDGYHGGPAGILLSLKAQWDLTVPSQCTPYDFWPSCPPAHVIPEPGTYLLAAAGLGLVAFSRRRLRIR